MKTRCADEPENAFNTEKECVFFIQTFTYLHY